MITTSGKGINRLYCDGCSRRLVSATDVQRLLHQALDVVEAGGMLLTSIPLTDLQWHAYCPDCARDPEATKQRRAERIELLKRVLWGSE